MDSSLEIKTITTLPKEYVNQNISVFNKVLSSLETISELAKDHLKSITSKDGRISNSLLEKHQFRAHGLAWFETYRIGLRETFNWIKLLQDTKNDTDLEYAVMVYAFSEYLNQMRYGIMISQSEVIRPSTLNVDDEKFSFFNSPDVQELINLGASDNISQIMISSMENGIFPNLGLNDDTLNMIQDQFRKFTDEEIVPTANEWHLKDDLIPDSVLKKMAELGVFSIAIPESYGGLGMGKVAMCVVTEELSRGFLAAGSLGTRAEIAGELIRLGGTEDQKNKYEIIAGERRWLAAQRAGIHNVPVVITEADDLKSLEFAIVENVQRHDLNPLEEAQGYKRLIDEFSYDQEKVSKFIGKSRSYITNSLRILTLPAEVIKLIEIQKLTTGHAKILVGLENASFVANKIIEKKLSVRQAENFVQLFKKKRQKSKITKDTNIIALELSVSNKIGLNVEIQNNKRNKGKISFEYKDLDQLNKIIDIIKSNY